MGFGSGVDRQRRGPGALGTVCRGDKPGVDSVMRAALAKPLDWCTIQLARLNVRGAADTEGLAARAQAVLDHPDFLSGFVGAPKDFRFVTKRAFRFTSPVPSPWK